MDWISILIVGIPALCLIIGAFFEVKEHGLPYLLFCLAFFFILFIIIAAADSMGEALYLILHRIGVSISRETSEKIMLAVIVVFAAIIFRVVERKIKEH